MQTSFLQTSKRGNEDKTFIFREGLIKNEAVWFTTVCISKSYMIKIWKIFLWILVKNGTNLYYP